MIPIITLCRSSAPRTTPQFPAAVGGGRFTLYVIYLLSQPIAQIGSNPPTFAAPADLHRTKGGIDPPGDASH